MYFTESENVELKSIYVEEIKKEIIAFANTRGGKIYIGIENNGKVCGVENSDFIIQQVSNSARDSIKPDVTMFMHYNVLNLEGKDVVEIEVQCGTHRPYFLSNKGLRPEGVYVRRGTTSIPASDNAIRQMIKETDGDNYEDMRSLNQELTFEKAAYEFKIRNLPFSEAQMKTLNLIDNDGIYSNLALLLSDQCPHIIKASTFDGIDMQNFQDRREFSGSILKQLEDAYSYMELRNKISASFSGLMRIDYKEYPETALREALLNAIVHRDYSLSADTLLSIYTDRMEIVSIGGLAGGISYDDIMLGISYCRNKNLANIFYRLKLIESYGTGMGKIMGSYSDSPIKPQIHISSGAFKIILPNQNQEITKNSISYTKPQKREIKTEQKLLELFKNNKTMSRLEVEQKLGISTSSARRILDKLIKEGYIVSSGTGKNHIYVFVE